MAPARTIIPHCDVAQNLPDSLSDAMLWSFEVCVDVIIVFGELLPSFARFVDLGGQLNAHHDDCKPNAADAGPSLCISELQVNANISSQQPRN